LNNICPSISWSDSITNSSYVFIFRNDLYSFPFNKPVIIKSRANNYCLSSTEYVTLLNTCDWFNQIFTIDLGGQIVDDRGRCLYGPYTTIPEIFSFTVCNGDERWAINQNDNEGYYNISKVDSIQRCARYNASVNSKIEAMTPCGNPFDINTQFYIGPR
jgi:hypothetical protein